MTDYNAETNARILRDLFDQASYQQRQDALNALRRPVASASASARPATPTRKPVAPSRKPVTAKRPAPASTRAERAQVLDTRPDLTAKQRVALDRPEMSVEAIRSVLTCIPRGKAPATAIKWGSEQQQAAWDRMCADPESTASPIKRTGYGTQFGTMSREQANAILNRGGK